MSAVRRPSVTDLFNRADLPALRRQVVRITALAAAAAAAAIAIVLAIFNPNVQLLGISVTIYVFGVALANFFWFGIVSTNYRLAASGLMFTLVTITWLNPPGAARLALITLVIAAVIAERGSWRFLLLVVLAKLVYETYSIFTTGSAIDASNLLTTNLITVIAAIAVRYVVSFTTRVVETSQRTAVLLRTSAEIGAVSTQLSDLKSLFDRVVTLIQERFGFYHVQVFVVNASGDQAVLQASTGEIGRRLLARRHQLAVGSQSVIGQVTLRGEYVIARDTDRDEVHFRNELLINTRSELAVPIRDGALVVGALDVQSTEPDTFDEIDVEALQVISDFLGTALRNSATYDEQARVAEENSVLLSEAEENNLRIQRLNRELTRASWDEFIQSERALTGVDSQNARVISRDEWSPNLEAAATQNRTISSQEGDRTMIAVPLTLRGEVIGAIEVESGTETDPATVSLIEDLAERMTISLENARLYEEAREATGQEQFINSLSARYQAANTVDELLRLTLLEVSETLGAQYGSIRLGKLEIGEDTPKNGAAAS